jgi:hypothetical protein
VYYFNTDDTDATAILSPGTIVLDGGQRARRAA